MSAKACAVREYRRIRSFMSQPDSQGTMAAKAPGPTVNLSSFLFL